MASCSTTFLKHLHLVALISCNMNPYQIGCFRLIQSQIEHSVKMGWILNKKFYYIIKINRKYHQRVMGVGNKKNFKDCMVYFFNISSFVNGYSLKCNKSYQMQNFETDDFAFYKIFDFLSKLPFFRPFCFSWVIFLTNYGQKSSSVAL